MTKNEEMNEIRMSLPEGVVASGFFTDNDLRVLDALSVLNGTDYAKENGEFFLTNERMKQLAKIKDNMTLSRSIKKLERCGFFERTPGRRGEATTYILHEDRMEKFTNANTNQKQCKKPKKRVTTMGETVTKKVTNDDMLPNLIINELQQLRETVTTTLNELVTEIATLNANLLKINMGNNSNKKGNKVEDVTTDTETDTEKESIKSISPVDTSPVLKEIERKKNKKNPDGDAPLASRDDDHGHFLFEMTADAVKGPSGGQPRSATESTTLNAQAREKDNPPAPRGTTVFGNDAFKGSLSAPEPQNELSITRAPETPPDATHEPQVASCEKTNASRDDAWYEEAIREAEATGNREMLRQLYAQRRNESFIATFGLPAAAPRPYPDTEPLGNVIYEHASTREARIERKATTRYA